MDFSPDDLPNGLTGVIKVGLLELNTVPQTDEERREQFELKRKIVDTLVEKVYIHAV